MTNSSGAVVERYAYTAFGQVTVYDPSWANPSQTSSVGNTRLFAGMDVDPLTGAYYDNARWYNPTNGTFFGRDPIGYAGGMNLYRYVSDRPTVHTDPSGTLQIYCVCVTQPHDSPNGSSSFGWAWQPLGRGDCEQAWQRWDRTMCGPASTITRTYRNRRRHRPWIDARSVF